MEFAALGLLGGGGAEPSLQLDINAEKAQCCNNTSCICCTRIDSDNPRMTVQNNVIRPEQKTFWEKVFDCFCCCCPCNPFHRSSQTDPKEAFDKYLKKEFTDPTIEVAQNINHIDLKEIKELRRNEAATISKSATDIRNDLNEINDLIKALNLRKNFQEIELSEAKRTSQLKEYDSSDDKELPEVITRTNEKEPFQESEIKKHLKKIPFKEPISEEQITKIAHEVKKEVLRLKQKQINTLRINQILARELKQEGIEPRSPKLEREEEGKGLIKRLEAHKTADELSTEELEALIKLKKKNKKLL